MDVKQLLLRVPDELHQRLARRAVVEGTSVNALATGVLNAAVLDVGVGGSVSTDLRSVLRARAAAAGLAVTTPALSATPVPTMGDVQAALAGLDRDADALLDEQRDPR